MFHRSPNTSDAQPARNRGCRDWGPPPSPSSSATGSGIQIDELQPPWFRHRDRRGDRNHDRRHRRRSLYDLSAEPPGRVLLNQLVLPLPLLPPCSPLHLAPVVPPSLPQP